jgi:hypothetical protein
LSKALERDDQAVSALEAIVKIGGGLSMDCYMVFGEFRYGLSQASELLGYESRYYSQVVRGRSNKLKTLQNKGFTGGTVLVKVPRSSGGVTRAKTLSFDDFSILVEYEAIEVKNPKAIALLTTAFRELLRGRTQAAFGLPEDDLEAKQAAFWESFQERETIWAENREDVESLRLAGDEDLADYYPEIAKWENQMLLAKCGL